VSTRQVQSLTSVSRDSGQKPRGKNAPPLEESGVNTGFTESWLAYIDESIHLYDFSHRLRIG
jgi:hypothetical protein